METKKKGRPAGINYDVSKIVKINNKQNENWNRETPKAIRDLLEGKLVSIELLKQLYDFMSDEKKCELKEVNNSDLDFIETIKKVFK